MQSASLVSQLIMSQPSAPENSRQLTWTIMLWHHLCYLLGSPHNWGYFQTTDVQLALPPYVAMPCGRRRRHKWRHRHLHRSSSADPRDVKLLAWPWSTFYWTIQPLFNIGCWWHALSSMCFVNLHVVVDLIVVKCMTCCRISKQIFEQIEIYLHCFANFKNPICVLCLRARESVHIYGLLWWR